MISDKGLRWIILIPTAAFLIIYGYWALFRTDRLIKFYLVKGKIEEGSFRYNFITSGTNRVSMKIIGGSIIIIGIALIVLLIWTTFYGN